MIDQEGFYLALQRFIDSDLTKIIYKNDNICVLNICNSMYAVTQYVRDEKNDYNAFMMNVDQVKRVIDNNLLLPVWITNMSLQELKSITITFNDKTFEIMKGIKKSTDLNGPSKYIDQDFEDEMDFTRK